MSDLIVHDAIRDGLRRGVSRGQIHGWYAWNGAHGEQMFTVRPLKGWCVPYDEKGALTFVQLLDAASRQ